MIIVLPSISGVYLSFGSGSFLLTLPFSMITISLFFNDSSINEMSEERFFTLLKLAIIDILTVPFPFFNSFNKNTSLRHMKKERKKDWNEF